MKASYFAWVRERVGVDSEELALPPDIVTVRDVVRWLKQRGENYAYAFENDQLIRAALDKRHVRPDTPISCAREIAFFPPMTGG
ncbi:MAG: molybdopterin converting factor subunit 1 [Beijerinckiaceae bacterium]